MKATCKVCRNRVDGSKMKQVFSRFTFDGQMQRQGSSLEDSFIEIVAKYPILYDWACDDCIKAGRALLGNPKKQFYTFTYPWDHASPHLVYYDRNFRCQNCNTKFTFSKEEQKYWYEELSFVVYSKPIHCLPCRKELRASKNLNKELSDLLREGKPDDLDKLARIVEIYEEMGKTDKMKAYQAELRKLKRKLEKK